MHSAPAPSPAPVALAVSELAVAVDTPGGRVSVIDELAFELRRGQIGCLLGPSGCGKTTALRAIAGFHRVDAGEIRLDGRVVASTTAWVEPERRGVGVVFQDYALFPHLNVADNVAFGLRSVAPERRRERIARMLALVGMKPFADRFPHELSGGQQ